MDIVKYYTRSSSAQTTEFSKYFLSILDKPTGASSLSEQFLCAHFSGRSATHDRGLSFQSRGSIGDRSGGDLRRRSGSDLHGLPAPKIRRHAVPRGCTNESDRPCGRAEFLAFHHN